MVKKNLNRWVIFLLIGVFTAFVGIFIDIAIEELSMRKYNTTQYCILRTIPDCVFIQKYFCLNVN